MDLLFFQERRSFQVPICCSFDKCHQITPLDSAGGIAVSQELIPFVGRSAIMLFFSTAYIMIHEFYLLWRLQFTTPPES